ncbi:MarR family transcriptional regulator [uncultured Clostridium sp.]|uniref:MarR family transcriptional regulator n=1 Tax=uncultured Clostridium sp. TaxID=59620 RepID=UPI0028EDFD31|nr:MarR family transcriptional regulator [uncultured Clostridium sp.]
MSNKLGELLISKVNFLSGRVFTRLIRKNKKLYINHAQGRILFILSRFKEMSINDLYKELSVSKSTLTSMLTHVCIL